MIYSIDWYTDIGGRPNNEDSVGVFHTETGPLCVIADGLGGHERGEVASSVTLQVLKDHVNGQISEGTMRQALNMANEEVLRLAGNERMKTTVAALWLQNREVLAATAGDTRIYQFRQGKIIFQSRDHSLAQLDAIAGNETYSDVRENPDRNKLIRVVGMRTGFKTDITPLKCQSGDAFLICSDGFWENVVESDMLHALSKADNAADWLSGMQEVLKVQLGSTSDNNSAIAVMIQ